MSRRRLQSLIPAYSSRSRGAGVLRFSLKMSGVWTDQSRVEMSHAALAVWLREECSAAPHTVLERGLDVTGDLVACTAAEIAERLPPLVRRQVRQYDLSAGTVVQRLGITHSAAEREGLRALPLEDAHAMGSGDGHHERDGLLGATPKLF